MAWCKYAVHHPVSADLLHPNLLHFDEENSKDRPQRRHCAAPLEAVPRLAGYAFFSE